MEPRALRAGVKPYPSVIKGDRIHVFLSYLPLLPSSEVRKGLLLERILHPLGKDLRHSLLNLPASSRAGYFYFTDGEIGLKGSQDQEFCLAPKGTVGSSQVQCQRMFPRRF